MTDFFRLMTIQRRRINARLITVDNCRRSPINKLYNCLTVRSINVDKIPRRYNTPTLLKFLRRDLFYNVIMFKADVLFLEKFQPRFHK